MSTFLVPASSVKQTFLFCEWEAHDGPWARGGLWVFCFWESELQVPSLECVLNVELGRKDIVDGCHHRSVVDACLPLLEYRISVTTALMKWDHVVMTRFPQLYLTLHNALPSHNPIAGRPLHCLDRAYPTFKTNTRIFSPCTIYQRPNLSGISIGAIKLQL